MTIKEKIQFIKGHTSPQILDAIKYKISKHDKTSLRYGPRRLVFLITSKCTLRCNMCPYKSPCKPDNSFKFDDLYINDFKRIVDIFSHAINLELSGGEPFLHKDIFDMIKYGYRKKMIITIFTNGTIIHDKIDQIINSGVSTLVISLDACSSEGYKKMRGGSKKVFERVLESIADLVEKRDKTNKNIKLRIGYICTKENYNDMPGMVRLAEDLGVDEVYFDNLIPYGIPGFLENQCLYDVDHEVLEVIKSIDLSKPKLKVYMPRFYKDEITERPCKMPFTTLTMDGNGNVSTCCMIAPHRRYGNVFQDNDVWNNSSFQRIRKILLDKSLPLPKFCKTCHCMGTERMVLSKE